MKPDPNIEPCEISVPDPLLRAVDAAERRVDAALGRVLVKLDANGRAACLREAEAASLRRRQARLAAPVDRDGKLDGRRQ